MAQDVADRDRPFRLLQEPVIAVLFHDQPLVVELGKVFLDGIVEGELALVHQHHERSGCDWLGLRGDPEKRVGPHRLAGGDVGVAHRVLAQNLLLIGHQSDGAGQAVAIDQRLQGPRDRFRGCRRRFLRRDGGQ